MTRARRAGTVTMASIVYCLRRIGGSPLALADRQIPKGGRRTWEQGQAPSGGRRVVLGAWRGNHRGDRNSKYFPSP